MEEKKKILGVDFGTKRIGLALGGATEISVAPLCVVKRQGDKIDIEKIMQIVRKYNVFKVVVGITSDHSGNLTMMGEKAKRFGQKLAAESGLPVAYFDESLTTFEAGHMLAGSGIRKEKHTEHIDKIAAAIILRDYLRGSHCDNEAQ